MKQHAAIITMRVDLDQRPGGGGYFEGQAIPACRRWTLRREYRSTYRAALSDTERVTAGVFTGRVDTRCRPWCRFHWRKNWRRDLQVGLGDEIVFDVQGVPVTTQGG